MLLVLGLVPLVGAIVVFALPRGRDLLAKQVTLLFSLATLAITIGALRRVRPTTRRDRFQFVTSYEWIRSLGVQLLVRRRRHRAGADRADRGAGAGGGDRVLERPRPRWSRPRRRRPPGVAARAGRRGRGEPADRRGGEDHRGAGPAGGRRRPGHPRRLGHRPGDRRGHRPAAGAGHPPRPAEDVLRAAAAARGHDDRRLRGHRRLPVLRVLRGHAHPDVLPHRRRSAARAGSTRR